MSPSFSLEAKTWPHRPIYLNVLFGRIRKIRKYGLLGVDVAQYEEMYNLGWILRF